jgi:hypothetical protein
MHCVLSHLFLCSVLAAQTQFYVEEELAEKYALAASAFAVFRGWRSNTSAETIGVLSDVVLVVTRRFGQLIAFVKQTEAAVAKIVGSTPTANTSPAAAAMPQLDNSRLPARPAAWLSPEPSLTILFAEVVETLVRQFATSWREGIEQVSCTRGATPT